VGILHDLHTRTTTLLRQLPATSKSTEIASVRKLLDQLNQSTLLLSTAQLIIRRPLNESHKQDSGGAGNGMEVDATRRISLGKMTQAEREERFYEDLKEDLRNLLGGAEELGVGGAEGFKGWLGGRAEKLLFADRSNDF
jgi:hypothetical protein